MFKTTKSFLMAQCHNSARQFATGVLTLLLLLGLVSAASAQQAKTSAAKTGETIQQKLTEKQTHSRLLRRLGLDSERMAGLRASFAEMHQQLANLPPGSPKRLQKYKEMRQAMMAKWQATMPERLAKFRERLRQAKLQAKTKTNNPKPE